MAHAEIPLDGGILHGFSVEQRRLEIGGGDGAGFAFGEFVGTGLDDEDAAAFFGETGGERTAAGAGADDDVVERRGQRIAGGLEQFRGGHGGHG